MVIRPFGKRVLIEKIYATEEKTTMSGIILSTSKNSESAMEGKVIAVGKLENEIETGDIIIYEQEGEVKVPNEKNMYVISLEHIYAIKRG